MKKLQFVILFALITFMSYSQEKVLQNPENFLSEITKISKETQSIEALFEQEKSVSYLKENIITSGKFYTQNGDMRWEQTKPYSYIMLLSESGVQVKDDGEEKQYGGMADKFMGQIRNILLSSVNGSFTNNKEFSPTYFEDNKTYIVKLTPTSRRLSKMFKGIHLNFDKTTFRLKTLTFVQEDGNSVMSFFDEKFNQKLENSLFSNF
ncbi:MAG: outer membrane lipoprotein-sorting protein [Planctomycetota bacterium]|jgi:outer membrane lipoprotein-sorting protein